MTISMGEGRNTERKRIDIGKKVKGFGPYRPGSGERTTWNPKPFGNLNLGFIRTKRFINWAL